MFFFLTFNMKILFEVNLKFLMFLFKEMTVDYKLINGALIGQFYCSESLDT